MTEHTPDTATITKLALDLKPDMGSANALRQIGNACLLIIRQNQPRVRVRHPEAVHAMRVSLRRLRVALSGFGEEIPRKEYRWVQSELRSVTRVLGKARDLHVLERNLQGSDTLTSLRELVEKKEQRAYHDTANMFDSPRYHALIHGLDMAFAPGGWSARKSIVVGTLAPVMLEKRYILAQKHSKNFTSQSRAKQHRLRLTLKKLRYTSEIAGSLYSEDRVSYFTHRLKQIQDILGHDHDMLIGRQIITALVRQQENPRLAEIGHNFLNDNTEIDHHRVERALRDFFTIPTFWL